MKIQESKFGQFEAFKVNNLKKVMGGLQIEDVCTGDGESADSKAITVYDNAQQAADDGCTAPNLRCHDAEFDCDDSTPTGL